MTTDTVPESEANASHSLKEARQLLAKGDIEEAHALLASVISTDDVTVDAYLLQARVLRRLNRDADSVQTAKAAAERFPNEVRAQLGFADELVAHGLIDEGREVLAKAQTLFPKEAAAHLLFAEASLFGDAPDGATAALEAAQELGIPSKHLPSLIVVLSGLGKDAEAKKAVRTLLATAPDQQTGVRLLKRALSRVEKLKDRERALVLVNFASSLLKDAPELGIWRAKYQLDLGRHRAALGVLNTIAADALGKLPKQLAVEVAEIRAIASRELKDREGVGEALEQLAELRPENALVLENLYLKSLRMGQPEKAKIFEARLQTKRATKLPRTLAEGLDALYTEPPEETLPAIVEWAWSLADQSASKFEEWKRAADWGKRASVLMKQWWMYSPDRSGEIGALIDPPDQSELDALPQGSGCVVVSSHMGPVAAGVHFGAQSGRRFRVYGRPGAGPASAGGAPVRIGTGQDLNATVRETVKELDSGAFIGFANDWRDPEGRSFQFLGREILLPIMAPRLVFSRRIPSLWWQPLWKRNRIIMEIARLPDPAEEEPFDEWIIRWAAAYLGHLEKVLRGAPENLNLGDGFWQNVSAEYAQSIRTRLAPGNAVAKIRERRAAR